MTTDSGKAAPVQCDAIDGDSPCDGGDRVWPTLDGYCAHAEHQRPGSRVQYEPADGTGFVYVDATGEVFS